MVNQTNRRMANFLFIPIFAALIISMQNCSSFSAFQLSSGKQLTSAQPIDVQDGVPGAQTYPRSIALDVNGNLYVAGATNGALDGQTYTGAHDFFISKYGPGGTRLWTMQRGSASLNLNLNAMAVSEKGDIYVTGETGASVDGQTQHGQFDLFIIKYNSDGVRQWTVQDGATSGMAGGEAIALDTLGNVYVTGYTSVAMDGQAHDSGAGDNLLITKYDSTGARLWTVLDASSSRSVVSAISVNGSDAVYVTGYTSSAIDGQTYTGTNGDNFFISKYNTSGTRVWTVEDGAAGGDTDSYGIATDASGNVYAAGTTSVAIDGQTQHGGDDIFITAYSSGGVRQWTRQDGATGASAQGSSVSVDSAGNAYLVGITTLALDGQTQHGLNDAVVVKYSSAGARQWTVQIGANGGTTAANGLAFDGLGGLHVFGYTSVPLGSLAQHGIIDFFLLTYDSAGVVK